MAGRFARSWSLMKASAEVLRSDKSLLMFPLASSICCLLVAASFLIPIIAAMVSAGHVVEHGLLGIEAEHFQAVQTGKFIRKYKDEGVKTE